MNTEAYRELDRRHLWHPYTRTSAMMEEPFPVIVRGEGVYLYDTEGRRYLDAISSWWACNLGHGNPRIVTAIRKQAGELQHSILGNMSHPRAIELAAQLAGLFPGGPRRALFASDGASAVEAALKISVQYWFNVGRPRRRLFVSLKGAYHGDTLGAVSVGRLEQFHRPFDSLLFPTLRAESPCCGRCASGRAPETCNVECFDSMRRLVVENSEDIAAVIVEPLCQGAAGMRIYSPRYLEKLAGLCREHGILLIADEIAVGFGRTGKMFAFEHAAGVDPDIVCLGKGLSAGYMPISATVVKESIFETFGGGPSDRTFYHGHTFAGNPMACAAAIETLNVYRDEDMVGKAARGGAALAEMMAGVRDVDGVVNVRCMGMIGAVEFGDVGRRPGAGEERAREVRRALFDRGILIRPLGNVVYLMPPLVIPRGDLALAVEAMGEAIARNAALDSPRCRKTHPSDRTRSLAGIDAGDHGSMSGEPTGTGPDQEPAHPGAAAKEARASVPILPVALLLEGRPCLVVGAGKVAARKVEQLVDAKSRVTVVGERISDAVRDLHERGVVRCEARAFQEEDVGGYALVFAATDDADANLRVLEACRRRGVLCGCVDHHWREGNLISPAVLRTDDITVAVSTGGRSCRRSRLIRDSLARHAAALGQADLLVTGTDHRLADLACRERLHLSSDGLAKAAEELRQVLGIHEFMLLSTCNRVELVGLATCTPALFGVVTKILGLNRLDRRFYVLRGFDAFRHLALVTAGLLSQTPRETHIRAQVKEALDLSRRNGWSAGILHDWVGRALRIGSAVRRETDSILTETEIEDRCMAFLEDAMGGLRHRRLLVVGSGNVGRNVVKDLLTRGASVSWCYHARAPEAVFPNGSQVPMWPMTNLRDGLRGQDAIVCAVSAADPVLTEEQASWLVPGHPVTVIDLGVPRNVASGFAAGRDNVRVVNLDDLDQWDRRHAARLQEALEVGDRVVKEHVEDYERVVSGIQTGD